MSAPSKYKFSVIVPCYNEEQTLEESVRQLLQIEDDQIALEVVIVDDASRDQSMQIARRLQERFPQIVIAQHAANQGKGAALNTGFQKATGDFIGIHDADLEYDPQDLRRLINPLLRHEADVVFGSRFLAAGEHRVLYFWHAMGNKFLTLLSNMFTDLNLTDMETCYKVFRAELVKPITIEEDRFGVEPELVAKIAHQRPRVYEMGISYRGRTYEEGKKIGVSDGWRALYCIFHYNIPKAPMPIQFFIYVGVGGLAAAINLIIYLVLLSLGQTLDVAVLVAFFLAAFVNYGLCVRFVFRHQAQWRPLVELGMFVVVVSAVAVCDLTATRFLLSAGMGHISAKLLASVLGLFLNFFGRRFLVFAEPSSGPWKPSRRK